eukprot:gnl/MRDRNA2_/MRDRNA2_70198_c0_seq1.p2 gnl/MRDRNA2_/MRDRNA2_70198_c0~~gnl/MRDRNA2_/MRDRNA2_70198_c0_seq1.p2  ORF type:complete len:434 (-),score=78.11 gnl/MRDRNA2_/MRDRNA2_70198_c0_seq1:59-1360(-)
MTNSAHSHAPQNGDRESSERSRRSKNGHVERHKVNLHMEQNVPPEVVIHQPAGWPEAGSEGSSYPGSPASRGIKPADHHNSDMSVFTFARHGAEEGDSIRHVTKQESDDIEDLVADLAPKMALATASLSTSMPVIDCHETSKPEVTGGLAESQNSTHSICEALKVAKSAVADLSMVLGMAADALQGMPNDESRRKQEHALSVIHQRTLAAERSEAELQSVINNAASIASNTQASDTERAEANAEMARASAGRAALQRAQEEVVAACQALLDRQASCVEPTSEFKDALQHLDIEKAQNPLAHQAGVLPWLVFERNKQEGARHMLPNIVALGTEAVERSQEAMRKAAPKRKFPNTKPTKGIGALNVALGDYRTRVCEEQKLHPHRYRVQADRHRLETPVPSEVAASLLASSSKAPAHNTIRPGSLNKLGVRAWHP